jgi:hypothetical protein
MKMSQHIAALIILLAEVKGDAEKAESGEWGSKVAGVRLRRQFQIVERELRGLRKTVILVRKANKAKKANKPPE